MITPLTHSVVSCREKTGRGRGGVMAWLQCVREAVVRARVCGE